jgi:hypothetical protein
MVSRSNTASIPGPWGIGAQEPWGCGWGAEALGPWNPGALEPWDPGTLGPWGHLSLSTVPLNCGGFFRGP